MIAPKIIATMVLFGSVGVVALALTLIARRYSVAALSIALAGLLALTTAATWITRAGTANEIAGSERDRALRDLAATRVQLAEARENDAKSTDETGRFKVALKAEQAKRRDADERAKTIEERAKAAEERAKAAEERAKVAEERAKAAEERTNSPSATPPRLPMPESPGPDDALGIRRKLDKHLDTKFYASQPLEQPELVAGCVGRWYVMRLQHGGKPFVFGDRQFRMPEAVDAIKTSLGQLQEKILGPARQRAKRVRLFLRGGADSRRVVGVTEVPDARELLFLPRLNDDSYDAVPRRLLPAEPVRNEDLPNLRADWLRQQILSVLPNVGSTDIDILENPPSPDHERTVDIVVYVEW
jgi:hypothetical protein